MSDPTLVEYVNELSRQLGRTASNVELMATRLVQLEDAHRALADENEHLREEIKGLISR